MTADRHPSDRERQELAVAVEAFSRDLLALVRSVRVYPAEHPFLLRVAGRLVAMVGTSLPDPLSLGVTSRELSLGPHFFGGRESRAGELAARLHASRLLRVTWTRETGLADAIGFAQLLGDPKLTGADLARALHRRRLFSIEVDALELERIHEAFQEDREAAPRPEGGREAWQWLLSGEVPPEELAGLLAADSFWQLPQEGQAGSALVGGEKPGAVLLRLGARLEEALGYLPPGQRRKVLDRLARVGRDLSPRDLAAVLGAADATGLLEGPIAEVVEESFGGDKLVDLLAGLVDREGLSTRRLAEVYGRLAHGDADELLGAVKARLASPEKGGFTAEVWAAVEEFLLGVKEGIYMGDEYSSSLEAFAAASPAPSPAPFAPDLPGDVEGHLDQVLLGLALDDPVRWGGRLLDRLGARAEHLPPDELLGLLGELDRGAPGLVDSRPAFAEQVLRLGLRRVRELDSAARDALLAFGRAHERALLDPTLRGLAEAESLSARRFLVDLVAEFSPAVTPTLVARVRSAPWYVTRNLTIALGRRGDEATVPVLRSLLGHEQAKVRREAILALGRLGAPAARDALGEVAGSRDRSREERALAERALRRAQP